MPLRFTLQLCKTYMTMRCRKISFILLVLTLPAHVFLILWALGSVGQSQRLQSFVQRGIDQIATGRLKSSEEYGGRLREFQSSLQETERLRLLLLTSPNASPPFLTLENCTQLSLKGTGLYNQSQHLNMSAEERAKNVQKIIRSTLNCTDYVLKSGFTFAKVSEEELSFPLAFSLLAYKDAEQVERLLRAVYRPHNVYCVHVDRKSDPVFQSAVRFIVDCLPNVFMAEKAVDVEWGKISVLEPEMECMRRLFAHRAKWRYFINLTGQEFPLKTNKELVQIFTALKGANIITGTTAEKFSFRWKNPKPVPYGINITKGDVHIAASRGYVDYVINSRVARDVYEWLRNSFIPDETFFSTMNYNRKLGVPGSFSGPLSTLELSSPRFYKIWDFNPDRHLCKGKFVRNICHFGVGDLPGLTSSPGLIANKFSYDYQPQAYDCLEKWYFEKVRKENDGMAMPLNVSFYETSRFVQHLYKGPVLIWE